MGSEWPVQTLREANVVLIDCDHRTPLAVENGIPYVCIPQLKHGNIDFTDARRISVQDFSEWTRRARPQPNDVVLSRRCNPGETAYVSENSDFALGQNLVLLRADGSVVHPPFLRWLVRSSAWWSQISRFLNVGAVFDSLKCADILEFELPIPPLNEQKRIAHILGTLDDKIELNRQMNKTLEEMARALFRSWFVDFDPVRAKMSGRWTRTTPLPGLPTSLFDLFPDHLVDSELGEIPAGWSIRPIGDLVDVVGGSTPSTKVPAYWESGTYNWATPKDLSLLQEPFLFDTGRRITDEGLAQIGSGSLPAGTVLLSSRAPIGYLAVAQVPVAVNQGIMAMKPSDLLPSSFLLNWTHFAMDEIIGRANGSTFLEISKSNFRNIPVVVPHSAVLNAFDNRAADIHARLGVSAMQNSDLTQIRQGLLENLI